MIATWAVPGSADSRVPEPQVRVQSAQALERRLQREAAEPEQQGSPEQAMQVLA